MTHQRIELIGHLGKDPEGRFIPSGTFVCNFNVATNRQYTDSKGSQIKTTTWHRVAVWGAQGEACNKWLKKGSEVFVEGRVEAKHWVDQQGTVHDQLEVTASNVRFLGSGSGNGNQAAPPPDEEEELADQAPPPPVEGRAF